LDIRRNEIRGNLTLRNDIRRNVTRGNEIRGNATRGNVFSGKCGLGEMVRGEMKYEESVCGETIIRGNESNPNQHELFGEFFKFSRFSCVTKLRKNWNPTDYNRHKVDLTLSYEKQTSWHIIFIYYNNYSKPIKFVCSPTGK
jgi:hypothetical protein